MGVLEGDGVKSLFASDLFPKIYLQDEPDVFRAINAERVPEVEQ